MLATFNKLYLVSYRQKKTQTVLNSTTLIKQNAEVYMLVAQLLHHQLIFGRVTKKDINSDYSKCVSR